MSPPDTEGDGSPASYIAGYQRTDSKHKYSGTILGRIYCCGFAMSASNSMLLHGDVMLFDFRYLSLLRHFFAFIL